MEALELNSYSDSMRSRLHAVWQVGEGLCLWGDPAAGLQLGRLISLRLHTPSGRFDTAAWSLSSTEALRLPARLRGTPIPLAPDARALLNVIWLLLRQLAAGQVLPTLRPAGTRWQARWQVQGWDPDALASTLPGACLAATPAGDTPIPAAVVIRDLLDVLADAAARSAFARSGSPLKARKRQAAGRWIMALHERRPAIDADEAALRRLSAALRQWTPPPTRAPLSLRLRPPVEATGWRLELGVLGTDGRHLDSDAIWEQPTSTPRADLLIGLAQAAEHLPMLSSLQGQRPTHLSLSRAEAEQFLVAEAETLTAAGVHVQLPALWRTPQAVTTQLRSHIDVDGLLSFDWQVALGGVEITAAELARIASQKAALVKHRGRWIRILPAEAEAAAADISQEGLDALRQGATSPLASLGDSRLRALFSGQRPAATPPDPRFQGTLRRYQSEGLGWLEHLANLGLGACLADDMGLGKTVQVLAHLCTTEGPTLLVCPLSVLVNWQREAARFAPHLTVRLHHGPQRLSGPMLAAAMTEADVLVTTYAVARSDRDDLAGVPWSRIVLDEAQHIKNPATETSRAIRSLSARHRIAMTGTPVENRLEELWSIFDFLSPGLLGSRAAFRSRYADPIEKRRDPLAASALRRLTGPFLLRRRKTDPEILSDLPPKVEIHEPCRLTVEQAALYQAQLEAIRSRLREADADDKMQRTVILGALTRLKQICNHPAQFLGEDAPLAGRSGKLARLEELLVSILALNDQVLIFTQYTAAAALIRDRILQRFRLEPLFLHGGLSHPQRQDLIDRFQDGSCPIFLLSLKAAGTGLTLTAASHVIHYDRWWNPAVEDQATDRAWRLGQTRSVQVRKLICVGTIEERIDALITSKRALAGEVIDVRGPSGLSTAELTQLLEAP